MSTLVEKQTVVMWKLDGSFGPNEGHTIAVTGIGTIPKEGDRVTIIPTECGFTSAEKRVFARTREIKHHFGPQHCVTVYLRKTGGET